MARKSPDREARERAVSQIRQFPDPVLRQTARPVEEFDDDLRQLAARMVRIMDDAHGAGLAAPQIGILKRLFVYQADADDDPRALVNPEIVERSDETAVGGEGCLSLQVLLREEHDVPVERARRIRVRALDVDGDEVELEAEGHEARVIQHELDHLDGVLLLDHLDDDQAKAAKKFVREMQMKRAEESGPAEGLDVGDQRVELSRVVGDPRDRACAGRTTPCRRRGWTNRDRAGN